MSMEVELIEKQNKADARTYELLYMHNQQKRKALEKMAEEILAQAYEEALLLSLEDGAYGVNLAVNERS